jgi:hypothetical protein
MGVRLRPMTTQQDRSSARIFPPLIPILAIAFSFVIQWVIPVGIFGTSRRLTLVAGWVLILAAAWIITWKARLMFRAGTTPDPTCPGTVLSLNAVPVNRIDARRGCLDHYRASAHRLGNVIFKPQPLGTTSCSTTAFIAYLLLRPQINRLLTPGTQLGLRASSDL